MAAQRGAADAELEKLLSSMSLTNLEIGTQFYAKVAHLNTPQDFYIVPSESMYHLPAITKVGELCLLEDLVLNMTVIFHSRTVSRHVRGIIKIIEDKCTIFAMDYGFTENNVAHDSIYHPLLQEAISIPPLAIHCEMYLCMPKSENFSEEAIEAFKYYMGDSDREKLKVFIKGKVGNKYIVSVYNSCPDDLSTMLCLTGYTNFADFTNYTRPSVEPEPLPIPLTFRHRKAKVGQNLDVRVQSGELGLDCFYVTPIAYYDKYLETRREFHSYCKSIGTITAERCVVGAAVGVLGDLGSYERGIITEIVRPNDKVKVKQVDLGNDLIVSLAKVKAVQTKVYTNVPVYSIYCSAVPNFQPKDHGLPSYFLNKGFTFKITVEQVGVGFEKPYIVSISKRD